MLEKPPPTMVRARSGDLARRVAERRREIGLTREDVALRAGMQSGYLDYLEHSPNAALAPEALLRLAAALETTADFLTGGHVDRPPGPGRAGPHPHLDLGVSNAADANEEDGFSGCECSGGRWRAPPR